MLDALNFGTRRIGHGHHLYDAPELWDRVRSSGVTLEICPTSNIQCKTQPSYRKHPAKKLLDAGIRVTINTDNSALAAVTLEEEYAHCLEEMGFRGRVRGHVYGPVANLNLADVVVDGLEEGVHLRTTGRITGLPDTDNTRLDFQLKELSFELKDLDDFVQDWAADVDLDTDHMAPDERFHLTGAITGLLNRMSFDGSIGSRIGEAEAHLTLSNAVNHTAAPLTIGGSLETENVHLGRILGSRDLGPVSLFTRLEARFPQGGDMRVRLDTLHVNRLQLMGYDYSGIEAAGHYAANDYAFHLESKDPNLQLLAQATIIARLYLMSLVDI